jgi:hypothetical protein
MRKLTHKEIAKTMKNPKTRVLVEWLNNTIGLTASGGKIMSDQFYHSSHDRIDRLVIDLTIQNYFPQIAKVEPYGKDGKIIHIK